jgi:prophage regulatory protein
MKEDSNTLAKIEKLLLAQKRTLNVEELSAFTGFSKSHIYKLTSAKRIPHNCPSGKLIIFDRIKVEEWLLSNPISFADDIEQEAINYVATNPWKGGDI